MHVLVTGGANGIGRAAVDMLLDDGHDVSVLDVDDDALDGMPDAVETVQGDVADPDRVQAAVGDAPWDVVVNDAGFQRRGAVEDMDMETVRQHFETNVFGLLHVTKAALPALHDSGGRVVNVSSLAGVAAAPTWGPYAASKHAVEALSDAMRMELRPYGVDVVTVAPGAVATGFNRRGLAHLETFLPGSRYADRYRRLLDGRMDGMAPDRAGRVVVRAATEAAPRPRYPVPWWSGLVPLVRAVLPAGVWDRVVGGRDGWT